MHFPRITHDPAVMGGKPCIRGLRVTVGAIVGLLASGASRERILQAYPYLESEDFDAALKMAQFFYQFPQFCYQQGVKRPNATNTATRLLYGEALFSDITGRAMRRIRGAMLKNDKLNASKQVETPQESK